MINFLRYALKDLWESEREYVKDLKFALDNYYKMFDKADELPSELQGQRDAVFGVYPSIHGFHKEYVTTHCNDAV